MNGRNPEILKYELNRLQNENSDTERSGFTHLFTFSTLFKRILELWTSQLPTVLLISTFLPTLNFHQFLSHTTGCFFKSVSNASKMLRLITSVKIFDTLLKSVKSIWETVDGEFTNLTGNEPHRHPHREVTIMGLNQVTSDSALITLNFCFHHSLLPLSFFFLFCKSTRNSSVILMARWVEK